MPQPCTTFRPCRCLKPAIIARGAAEPPTSIPFIRDRSYCSGSASSIARMPSQIVGTPAVQVTPSVDEVVEQALGVEVRPRVDELRADHRREIRVAPRVGVEHRHDRQDRVLLARCRAPSGCRRRRRACAATSSGASRGRPSASRSCRSCNTWPPPRSRPAPGRPTRPGRRRRRAPRRSPRRRARARSSSCRGSARAAAAGCGRRSRPCPRRAFAMYARSFGCRRRFSVCSTKPPHGMPRYASWCW